MRIDKALQFGFAVVAVMHTASSSAKVLASYTFDGTSGSTLNADTVAAGVVADPVSFGSGGMGVENTVVTPTTFSYAATQRVETTQDGTLASTFAPEGGNQNYLSITLDFSAAAAPVSVSEVSYRYYLTGSVTDGAYASHLLLDSFAAPIGTFTADDEIGTDPIVGTNSNTDSNNIATIDTSNISVLQNLSGEITLRIYVTDEQGQSGHRHVIDDITISSIPEPGSLATGLFGLGVLCLRRRRSHRRQA